MIQEQLEIETKIKKGAEMMLNLDKVPSEEISQQLKISEAKISGLNRQLHELKNSPGINLLILQSPSHTKKKKEKQKYQKISKNIIILT